MPSVLPIWEFSAPEPARNLAADEALLDWCEAAPGRGALRFWESTVHFAVLGYGNRAAQELRLDVCAAAGVPVLRRCSGGGTVLQGPGCLNYALVLDTGLAPELETVTSTNRFVMERHRAAMQTLLGRPVSVEGVTDLVIGERKFSGNAQRRRRHSVLFHGTILLDFDLELVARFLLPPPRQPEYRRGRPHAEFITNLPLQTAAVKAALAHAWNAHGAFTGDLDDAISRLIEERYACDAWNLRR